MVHLCSVLILIGISSLLVLQTCSDHLRRSDAAAAAVTNTRCHIGTVFSPDDGHTVAQNVYRKAINILRKIVHKFGSIY